MAKGKDKPSREKGKKPLISKEEKRKQKKQKRDEQKKEQKKIVPASRPTTHESKE